MNTISALPVVESGVDIRGDEFAANREAWVDIINAFEAASKAVTVEATTSSQTKHQSRGQLLGLLITSRSGDWN